MSTDGHSNRVMADLPCDTPAVIFFKMSHTRKNIAGEEILFDHLQPLHRRVTLKLQGGHEKAVPVTFEFSCHCYSRGLKPGESAPTGHGISDGSIETPRERTFDPERYELSKGLPARIDCLIASNSTITRTRHENYFRVDQVETVREGVTTSVSYFMFFHARKVAEPNRPKSLRIYVESAYPEQDGIPHPQGKGSWSFAEMLSAVWVKG